MGRIFGLVLLGLILILTGCAAKKTIFMGLEPISELRCNVKVYSSLGEAEQGGPIEEICSISGAGTIPALSDKEAVNKIKDQVCECGANKAYVVQTSKGPFGTRTASVIGFRYLSGKDHK